MGWEYRHMPLPEGLEQEQFSWFERALQKGDGQLSVYQLAGMLAGQQERSLIASVHVTGAGVDEWRYHNYAARAILPSNNSRVAYDDILNSRILYRIPRHVLRQDRCDDVRREIIEHFASLVSNYPSDNAVTRTDIIFRRHRHPIHGGAYLSAEAGIMRALMPFCFKELEEFGLSLNHFWRQKYHFGFVRSLIERGNPQLSHLKTASGEPAGPIRFTNLVEFWPLWRFLIQRVSMKAAAAFRGRQGLRPHVQKTHASALPAGRKAWLQWAANQKLLETSWMCTANLYNPSELMNLVQLTLTGQAPQGEFLDRVITLEMAMRASSASLD
jgi:hypothetical protein